MNRQEKRKADRQATSIVKNAKIDMVKWVEDIGYQPTELEALAWQKGYIAGVSRINQYSEGNK
jgi:hypothetical protein